MKKLTLILILSAILGISTLTGCGSSDKIKVKSTINAENSSKKNLVYLMAGKISTNENVNISPKITDKVTETYVDVGSKVKKGDLLIKLDSKELQAQVTKAEAAVNTAQANLVKIHSSARPEQIYQAQAAVDGAKAKYENSKTTYERNQKLFDTGAISKSQLEELQTSLVEAEASYNSSKASLDLLNKGETQESINIAESQVKEAQAALDIAKNQLENAVIISPISGVVTEKTINTGELAAAGSTLITVVNSDTMLINAYLPAAYINRVKVGQEVIIKVAEIPDKEFNGEIFMIDSVVDSKNKNILVKVSFKDQYMQLKPGMFVEVGVRD
ncbi:efflux RND transporter periplasmic adaptor subunit [Clostridium sp. PL3]|uniref:Efflux RND transporter periplasmic adaptor subunit n=1 Tax=Clostridium thailandense TaxID=2794346 RepID=A0A949TND6_9CLOT|nr:efflux RND transporter periplasmic adaptor subunit [Clostridium thailandense]MBV7275595.1 efflux RND transporter periplasmic adaptor subunit [Clostridium thailandense]